MSKTSNSSRKIKTINNHWAAKMVITSGFDNRGCLTECVCDREEVEEIIQWIGPV